MSAQLLATHSSIISEMSSQLLKVLPEKAMTSPPRQSLVVKMGDFELNAPVRRGLALWFVVAAGLDCFFWRSAWRCRWLAGWLAGVAG
jgi:O-methyltransferase involved in polyketide biosynthesis